MYQRFNYVKIPLKKVGIRMIETLLIIVIILICIAIAFMVYLAFFKKSKVQTDIDGLLIQKYLEDGRLKTVEDLNKSVSNQKDELYAFKSLISENIAKFEKSNQETIVNFLKETEKKITELQHNFDIKSEKVTTNNQKQVSELLEKTTKEINELKTKLLKEINDSNTQNNERLNNHNVTVQNRIQTQMDELKDQVKKSLEQGFEKNEKKMHEFIEKMALLETSNKQMESLQNEINRFNRILADQKSRGNFGEGILEQIFENIFGEDKEKMFYDKQVNLSKTYGAKEIVTSKGKVEPIVDFVYYIQTETDRLPLSIDAKFPYTNYIKLLDDSLSTSELTEYAKTFKTNVKERIREVSKYIIDGVTAPYAIMFIPAEAVFMDIYKRFPDLVEDARKLRVVLASPSLIITIIQMIQVVLKDYKKRSNAESILKLIDDIGDDFKRFVDRFDAHKNRITQLNKSVEDLDITHGKIIKKLEYVKNVTDI